MREKIREHKWSVIFWLLLFLMAIYTLIRMTMPEQNWNFEAQKLELAGEGIFFDAGVIEENLPGWYVDNSMAYGDIFTQSPAVDLPAGSYEVTIFYQTQGNGAQYSFVSESSLDQVAMGRRDALLKPGISKQVMELNCIKAVKGFSVQTEYTGDGYLIVSGLEIRQTRTLERIVLFVLLFLGAAWFLWMKIRKREEVKRVAFWSVAIAFFASLPLFAPYLHQGDDIIFHLMRINGIAEGLKTGQFPVRIQPGWMNGYGYPVSIFYSDGILWVAGILRIIGFSLQTSFKLYICLINIMTVVISWWSLKRIFRDSQIAMAGALVYALAPYRLQNIYSRAALGEYTAMAFMPFILVGAYEILMEEKAARKGSWLILTAGMTGIIQSHILTCEIVVVMLGITCLLCWRRTLERSRLTDFIKAVLGTVLLNAGFLVPFVDYLGEDLYVNSGRFNEQIQLHGVSLDQIFELFPNGSGREYENIILTSTPERSFAIGITFLLALAIFLREKKIHVKKRTAEKRLAVFCCTASIILLFMSTMWFPWDFLYELNDIFEALISKLQFPWRLLGTASLTLTIVWCMVLKSWTESRKKETALGLAVVLVGLAGVSAGYFFSTLNAMPKICAPDVSTLDTFGVSNGEYVPEGVSIDTDMMPEEKLWYNEGVEVTYYRGYEAQNPVSGVTFTTEAGENGRLRMWLPGGYNGTVTVRFKEPLLWRISEMIAILSIIGLIIYLYRDYGNRKIGGKLAWIK